MSDPRPSIDIALNAFALDATVTPPGGPAVETRAFWLPSDTAEVPQGGDLRRAEQKRVLVLPLAGLPLVPRGTIVNIPEYEGAEPADWRIDATQKAAHDHYRVVVVPVTVAT